MLVINTIFFLLYFITAITLAWYIPGSIVLGKKRQLSGFAKIIISLVIGMVLWGWQGFVFGYMQIRWMSYLYLFVFLLFWVILFITRIRKQELQIKNIFQFHNSRFILRWNSFEWIIRNSLKKFDWIIISLITIGIISQTLPFYTMGWQTKQGVIVSVHNNPDHIWHAALVRELSVRFPPDEPGMIGVALKDYHYWFDLVTAELIRIFHLPIFPTQFLGMYVLGSVLFGLVSYLLSKVIIADKNFQRWFFFFLYFSGDIAGYFVLLIRHVFSWQAGSINDATSFIDGPPFAYSMIIAFTATYLLFTHRKKLPPSIIFFLSLLFGTIVGFKVYTGIVFSFGLFALGIYDSFKKQYITTIIFFLSSILAGVIFFVDSSGINSLFFLPFDIPRGFFADKNFGLIFIEQRWRIYSQHNNISRIIEYDTLMIVVYIIVEFGTRLIGMYPPKNFLKDKAIFFYSGISFAYIMGFLFYQKIGGANIWEFFLPMLIMLSIPAALNMFVLSQKNKVMYVFFAIIIIILTIPRWVVSTKDNLYYEYFTGFHGISNAELQSFLFLKSHTSKNSTILVVNQKNYQTYASIISVYTDRNLYLSGVGVRQITTPIITSRTLDVATIKNSSNAFVVNNTLHKDKINYIYVYGKPNFKVPMTALHLRAIFKNNIATILKIY